MKLFKLTDENGKTLRNTQWGENVTHSALGPEGKHLCSNSWIHAYESPLLAILLSPIYVNFNRPRLWEAEGEIGIRDGQLKCGCRSLTTLREIPLPIITTEQRVIFAILICKAGYTDSAWNSWADNWLSGHNRAAGAGAGAAEAAAAARAARGAKAVAAWAAAAGAAGAAEAAAAWVAWAAEYITHQSISVDLISLAEQAMRY